MGAKLSNKVNGAQSQPPLFSSRKTFSTQLTNLVDNCPKPYVISIEASWGTGKTTFMRHWAEVYGTRRKKKKTPIVIYFNAWQTDYATDPLLAFMAQLDKEISENQNYAWLKKSAETAGNAISSICAGLKKALSNSRFESTKVETAKAIIHFIDGFQSKQHQLKQRYYSDFLAQQSAIKELKTNLRAFSREVEKATGKPLVIIVDELDRCRPEYAVTLLERMRHFFADDTVADSEKAQTVFVLSSSMKQLENYVSHVFGAHEDAQNPSHEPYLRKFIDLNLSLPDPTHMEFAQQLFDTSQLIKDIPPFEPGEGVKGTKAESYAAKDIGAAMYGTLCKQYGISPRNMEKGMRHIEVTLASLREATQDNKRIWLNHMVCAATLVPLRYRFRENYLKVLETLKSGIFPNNNDGIYQRLEQRKNDLDGSDGKELCKYSRFTYQEDFYSPSMSYENHGPKYNHKNQTFIAHFLFLASQQKIPIPKGRNMECANSLIKEMNLANNQSMSILLKNMNNLGNWICNCAYKVNLRIEQLSSSLNDLPFGSIVSREDTREVIITKGDPILERPRRY